jgi:glutamate racemase
MNLELFDPRPIGVFDSGVGGLSVLNQLLKNFPNESFVYLGDTARLPYGSKSSQTIARYVTQNINYLIVNQNIKAIVVACNSASTVLSDVVINSDIPIFGVIEPGAASALATTKNHKIAVWATRATIQKQSYAMALKKLNPKVQVTSVPCPLLVPLVEEGLWEGPITDAVIDLYLHELHQTDVDTLILGCTHYPFIKAALQARIESLTSQTDVKSKNIEVAINPNLKIVDSAEAICLNLKTAFNEHKITSSKNSQTLSLLLTDEASHFMNLVAKSFPDWKNIKFQLIDLHQIV